MLTLIAYGDEAEFRAFWADAWHDGFQNATQVDKLIADIRKANCNAVFVQVRKRGDAYYKGSPYEPPAKAVSASFDPLGEVVRKAHDTNSGPRIEVHAWFVTYPITSEMWLVRDTNRPVIVAKLEPQHPFNLHPDWLNHAQGGATFDQRHYSFDPGHPEVQRHLFNVAMDIITRYDIDGFHFDYVRYTSSDWGYNSSTVSRFNTLFKKQGVPSRGDPAWSQFRRDQITALIRKIYLSAIAIKPLVKISASTVTWVPGITGEERWQTAMPYRTALQDWQAWMQEGILDMNVPMVFFREAVPSEVKASADWLRYAKDHKYERQVVVGQAAFLNSFYGSGVQLRAARKPTAKGNSAAGVVLYSYAVPSKDDFEVPSFMNEVSKPTSPRYLLDGRPLFEKPVTPPEMPWKTRPTKGHLMGFVYAGLTTNTVDGAFITLTGAGERKLISDGTGFFGGVDLPPGRYTLIASTEKGRATNTCTVAKAKVSVLDLRLPQ